MSRLDHFLLPQDGRNSFCAPYRPSIFLCCILLLLAASSLVGEVMSLSGLIIFPITTYCPTLYFALQSIIRTRRQSHTSSEASKITTERATVLAIFWVITILAHVFFWYDNRKDAFSSVFLLPVFPGSNATLVMIYIAVRYNLHEAAAKRNGIMLRAPDEEATDPVPPLPAIASQDQASSNLSTTPVGDDVYQPLIPTLILSICLTILIAVDDARRTFGDLTPLFWGVCLILAFLPTILFQLYVITRTLRHEKTTPEDLSAIAGFCFEITIFWIWTRAFLIFLALRLYHAWAILGFVETLLMLYLSTRYAISLRKATERYNQSHPREDSFISTPTLTGSQRIQNEENPCQEVYHPSIFTLLLALLLCGMCAFIEIGIDPNIGIPMTILVYAPTAAVFLHWITRSFQQNPPNSYLTYNRAADYSIGLFVLWVLTQAFYVFLWPMSQYFPVVMNPYVRWPAVVVVGYIAGRYGWDRRRRERDGQGTGVIALPPDNPHQDEGGGSLA